MQDVGVTFRPRCNWFFQLLFSCFGAIFFGRKQLDGGKHDS